MSDLARHLWRFPTGAAQESLARRFGLPNEEGMQDWEYEVADYDRIDDYLVAYQSGELSDDERFSLMEMLMEAFRGSNDLATSPRFQLVLQLIEANLDLHLYSIWYWACMDDEIEDAFENAPFMRDIIARHPDRFELEPSETLESHEI
jgi:hypothetical protein